MNLNERGIQVMHEFEGIKLEAYLCPAKVPTIGWGNTRYEDGTPVKMGESISRQRADELFKNIASTFARGVDNLVTANLNDNQFSALVCFAYNVGIGNLKRSTLLRKVNANPEDPGIRGEFMRWNKAGGRELAGLTRRRKAEADLYFTPSLG
ncbi:lysozyme [Pleomorphovibrio marinus]|uniref:lysozyme n=1 Tax=Pleomorphovibrio marinus TaxID=2164132 RepID=UPI000E0C3315|nr:lysozyme [Pleomorphovibrio marinus]